MGFNEYQSKTAQTAIYDKKDALTYLGFGLASEAGEVCGKLKKIVRDFPDHWEAGAVGFTTEQLQLLMDELGDVLWYVARLADEVGFDLIDVAENNIYKLFSRKERGTISGSGDTR